MLFYTYNSGMIYNRLSVVILNNIYHIYHLFQWNTRFKISFVILYIGIKKYIWNIIFLFNYYTISKKKLIYKMNEGNRKRKKKNIYSSFQNIFSEIREIEK